MGTAVWRFYSKLFSFVAENSRIECQFPSWLGSEQWNSLDRHRQIKVEGKSTLVGNFSDFLTHEQRVNGLERSAVQVQFQCQSLLKDEDNYVALVAKQVTGWYVPKILRC